MDLIGDLDRNLAEVGEDMILRRKVNGTNVDVTIRAVKRVVKRPDNLVSGNTQQVYKVVGSMTQIRAANWPGVAPSGVAPFIRDPAVPVVGDEIISQGWRFRVDSSDPIAVDNVVVRFVLLIKGALAGT